MFESNILKTRNRCYLGLLRFCFPRNGNGLYVLVCLPADMVMVSRDHYVILSLNLRYILKTVLGVPWLIASEKLSSPTNRRMGKIKILFFSRRFFH